MDVLFVLTAIFIGVVILSGLFVMFSNATNIERNFLVGLLTVISGGIAAFLLYRYQVSGDPRNGGLLAGIGVVSVLGFAIGRIADLMLGPKDHTVDEREGTLGADISD